MQASERGEQLFEVGRVADAAVAPRVGLLRALDHRAAAQLGQAAIVRGRKLLASVRVGVRARGQG